MADTLTGAARPETLEECGGLLDQFCLLERSVREHLLFAIEWYADTRVVAAEAAAEARGHDRGIKEWRDIADKYTLKWDAELVRRVAAERALQALFSHIEAGDLVRNTARDDEPGFAIRSMNLVMALKRAHDILSGNAAAKPLPIDMLLHCPSCGFQHVDAPEPGTDWNNPPHKSHKCHRCGKVWCPADVPTNGVAAVKTRGKADTWPELRPHPPVGEQGEDPAKCEHAWEPHLWEPDSEYCPYCRSLRPRRK